MARPESSLLNVLHIAGSALAAVMALLAIWLIATEIGRPAAIFFPDQSQMRSGQSGPTAGGIIDWLRGDVLTEEAVSQFATGTDTAASGGRREQLIRAVSLAPYDSRGWLLLAALNAHAEWDDPKVAAQLKMSFYTGANEHRLAPRRLQIAIRARKLSDDEFNALIIHDVRLVAADSNPKVEALKAALRGGSQEGRRFLLDQVAQFNSALASELVAPTN